MDALVYTRDGQEYGMFFKILGEELPGVTIRRGMLDGHYHMEQEYDIVVVSVNGAEGMELVCKYRELYSSTLVIWVTDDRYFAGMAIQMHVFDLQTKQLLTSARINPMWCMQRLRIIRGMWLIFPLVVWYLMQHSRRRNCVQT